MTSSKRCIVSTGSGPFHVLDSFSSMEYAIMFWDRFQGRSDAMDEIVEHYRLNGSRSLVSPRLKEVAT